MVHPQTAALVITGFLLGAFFFAAAYRKNLTGVLKGGVAQFTNVQRV